MQILGDFIEIQTNIIVLTLEIDPVPYFCCVRRCILVRMSAKFFQGNAYFCLSFCFVYDCFIANNTKTQNISHYTTTCYLMS